MIMMGVFRMMMMMVFRMMMTMMVMMMMMMVSQISSILTSSLGRKFVAFSHVCSQFVRQSLNTAYRRFKQVTYPVLVFSKIHDHHHRSFCLHVMSPAASGDTPPRMLTHKTPLGMIMIWWWWWLWWYLIMILFLIAMMMTSYHSPWADALA